MSNSAEATENLRLIRSLMERATFYRLISAPSALTGGAVTLAAAALLCFLDLPRIGYLGAWLLAFSLTVLANAIFMHRDALRREAPVLNPAFKHGLVSLLPAATIGLILGAASIRWSYLLPGSIWCTFYGLALLTTRTYSPRSMQILAWVFCLTGTLSLLFLSGTSIGENAPRFDLAHASPTQGALFMGGTFGLFHLIYGILVGRKTRFRLTDVSARP